MIDTAFVLDIRDHVGLMVLEELGFDSTFDGPYPLEDVVKATVGVVDVLNVYVICDLMVAGGTPAADVYATKAWAEWIPGNTLGRHIAALAVIARLSNMTA